MNKFLISAGIAALAVAGITAQNTSNDPVLMTVDGNDVYLSEFEYLYNKNNNQQLVPLTFDQYVDMFVNYKLKVADARHMGLDTLQTYKSEAAKFGRDLAMPFLRDSTATLALIDEAVAHNSEDVFVSHIMLDRFEPNAEYKLDSLRNVILSGESTFEDVARRYSIDGASARRGGRMSWITGSGSYPWAFEKAAYDTPVGQISEVVNSGFGYHIIRPEERRPAAGKVLARHILVFTRGLPADKQAEAKHKIDSIYAVVTAEGADFASVAKQVSEDRGSASKGGQLDWFGPGQMVAPFDSIAFAMPVGAISEPFETTYGYHIIQKLDHKGNGTYAELRPRIEDAMQRDERRDAPLRVTLDRTAKEIGASILPEYKQSVRNIITQYGPECNQNVIEHLRDDQTIVFVVNGTSYTLAQILADAPLRETSEVSELIYLVDNSVQKAFDNAIIDYAITKLYVDEPEYHNLTNEYRDGILAFDASQKMVWNKAANDKKALTKYFKANKKKYSDWKAPKYKAYVIFVTTDSLCSEVQNYINKKYGKKDIKKVDQESFVQDLKDRFGSQVKIERVIAAKGENAITDYLGFGGDKPENKSKHFETYFAYGGKVINQPEEYLDVKGRVITDYQNLLEQQWLSDLHKKYPVEINPDVLQIARDRE